MLPGMTDGGIGLILYLQNLGNWMNFSMKFFTFLGSENFFLLIAPALYWCIDASTGLRLGLFLSLNAGLNSITKILFHSPRPYWVNRQVIALSTETSFGLPSGHAQNAVVVWGSLANGIKKRWAWIVAVLLMILIGFSRVYLGVHFPGDVLAGWLIGFLVLLLFFRLENQAIAFLRKRRLAYQVFIVFSFSIAIIIISIVVRHSLVSWTVPQQWINNAAASAPDADPIDPLSIAGIISNAAVFFGLASGALWLFSRAGFTTDGLWWQLLLRYALGLIGVIILWFGLDQIFPDGKDIMSYSLRYLRYALVGIWVSGLALALFVRLGIARPKYPVVS